MVGPWIVFLRVDDAYGVFYQKVRFRRALAAFLATDFFARGAVGVVGPDSSLLAGGSLYAVFLAQPVLRCKIMYRINRDPLPPPQTRQAKGYIMRGGECVQPYTQQNAITKPQSTRGVSKVRWDQTGK